MKVMPTPEAKLQAHIISEKQHSSFVPPTWWKSDR